MTPIAESALEQLFLAARTHHAWQPREVPDFVLEQLYDLLRMAPTSANCQPATVPATVNAAAQPRGGICAKPRS